MSDAIDAAQALAEYTPLGCSTRQCEVGADVAEHISKRAESPSVADPVILAELLALAADPTPLIGEPK
jgi:hypothetical protein